MKRLTWKNLLRTYSFDDEIKEKLETLNRLKMKGDPDATDFGTATERQQIQRDGMEDYYLDQLDDMILSRERQRRRGIIIPDYK